jgi:methyl-accepting chemotaxis protein
MDSSSIDVLGESTMSPTLKKTIAVLMVCVTSIGILLSLFFLIQIWRNRQPVTVKLQSAFYKTSALLKTTVSGLDVIDQMVTTVYSSTIYLDDATNSLAQTVQSTNEFIDSAGSFMGEDLITTITNTQRTLESAQSSALVIDNILTALSRVPLLGLDYNPSQPLNDALGDVSKSLDPLQGTLKGFQDNLTDTQTNIQEFQDQLLKLEQNFNEINQNLASSKTTIDNYRNQVTSLHSWVDKAIISLPAWVSAMCVILTIFILLLILVQVGILLQGIYLLSGFGTNLVETSKNNSD